MAEFVEPKEVEEQVVSSVQAALLRLD
jgi:hypothetical protein